MKQVLCLSLALIVSFVSGQTQPDVSCNQEPAGTDPGTGNYGDLICDLSSVQPVEETPMLIFRDTKINLIEGIIGETLWWFVEGYTVTKVNYLNFGQQRGFVTGINITNAVSEGMTLIQAAYNNNPGEHVRMLLELYGSALPERTEPARTVSRFITPKYNV